jgi:hypothetical protein
MSPSHIYTLHGWLSYSSHCGGGRGGVKKQNSEVEERVDESGMRGEE